MKIKILFILLILLSFNTFAQNTRTLSGTIVTTQFELVPSVTVEVQTTNGTLTTVSDAEGNFSLKVPLDVFSVKFSGNNIEPLTQNFSSGDKTENLQIKIKFVVLPISEAVTIQNDALTPDI
ncbi:MAG TPA: carboxypeptidase regulatory-like domain-containing protein, partial [Pyrinomonadaceae bacterium]|nr:carboxypeptidase regulatory-like domain-containing protein [Pyrinomonadaceae bacterium]